MSVYQIKKKVIKTDTNEEIEILYENGYLKIIKFKM